MTARAERGPQWDIGTQQYVSLYFIDDRPLHPRTRFHVETNSDLYYNPTPLLEVVKKELEDDSSDIQAELHVTQHGQHLPPGSMSHPGQQLPPGVFHPGTRHQTPMRGGDPRGEFHNMPPGMHPQMVQGGGHPHGPPSGAQMNFPSGAFPGASGAPVMNIRQGFPVTPFNAGPPGQFFSSDSGASPMRGPPAHMGGMNVGVGMPGGGIAGMGGMPRGMPPPGINLNMPPEVRRMRGMPEDFPIN